MPVVVSPAMITVRVMVFGPLRDILGEPDITLEVPAQCTGEEAFEALASQHPQLRAWRKSLRLAVNLEYVPFATRLNDGDEVGFLPPVSGG
jgi:molybdopterin converting factor subunit 1